MTLPLRSARLRRQKSKFDRRSSTSAFATFFSQAAQQGYKPKIDTMAKALLFPTTLDSLGELGNNLTCELCMNTHFPQVQPHR